MVKTDRFEWGFKEGKTSWGMQERDSKKEEHHRVLPFWEGLYPGFGNITPPCQLLEHRKFWRSGQSSPGFSFSFLPSLPSFTHPTLCAYQFLILPYFPYLRANIHRPKDSGATQVVCNVSQRAERQSLLRWIFQSIRNPIRILIRWMQPKDCQVQYF